ncbi:MAG: hypothetical protein RSC55_07750 [Oscillospiraceae bacterium]
MKRQRDTAIAIATFVFLVDGRNDLLSIMIFSCRCQSLFMIVMGCARKMGGFQKNV